MFPIPKGYKNYFLDWLNGYSPSFKKNCYIKVYDEESIECQIPKCCHLSKTSKFLNNYKSPEAFISIIPKGRVWGEFGAILTPDNFVIAEYSHQNTNYLDIESHPIFQQSQLSTPQKITGNVAVITSVFSSNYYHFIFDIIARIHLIQKSQVNVDKYIINGCKMEFQKKWLQLIDIPLDKLWITDKDLHIEATNIIVPSYDQPVGHAAPWAIKYLNSIGQKMYNLNINQFNNYPKKMYLPRSHMSYRRVSNELDVKKHLMALGFSDIYPEQFPIEKQFQIFFNAETIVAPSGAALTNLLFCKPKTKLLLFQPKGLEDISYYIICNVLKIDYYLIEGNVIENKNFPLNLADLSINTNNLKSILKIMG